MPTKSIRTPQLTTKQLQARVFKRLSSLDEMNLLERYAHFMGRAQIIELTLKGLLARKYGFTDDQLERVTLGGAISRLQKAGLRADFINLLRQLNEHRIEMAHEFLAVHASGVGMFGKGFARLSEKPLRYALFKVEEVIVVYDYLVKHDYL